MSCGMSWGRARANRFHRPRRVGGTTVVRAGVALALLVVLFGGLQAAPAAALSNGLALTPPMGWDSWNSVGCAVSSDVVERAADAMVSSGMSRAGYRYVVVDDCWMAKNRTAGGELQPDPTRFPKGIKALADYVHAAGLLFGLYETPGDVTCAGNAGSYGHEEQDVATMVRWGIDYLKYDACTYPSMAPDGADATAWLKTGFSKMRDLLAKSGRPVVYSINPTGFTDVAPAPWTWAANIANLWRVG
ncbi:MAG: melA, partial [Acidimicrobiia bacterium]|nr:melA [Acidimicrobiia bacterium]